MKKLGETICCEVFLKEDIIIFKYFEGAEVTLECIKASEEIALSTGVVYSKALVIPGEDFRVTKESQEWNKNPENYKEGDCIAFVTKNTATRLVGNVYLKMFTVPAKRKLVKSEEEGIKWLKSCCTIEPKPID